jgi:hypothetical protein
MFPASDIAMRATDRRISLGTNMISNVAIPSRLGINAEALNACSSSVPKAETKQMNDRHSGQLNTHCSKAWGAYFWPAACQLLTSGWPAADDHLPKFGQPPAKSTIRWQSTVQRLTSGWPKFHP